MAAAVEVEVEVVAEVRRFLVELGCVFVTQGISGGAGGGKKVVVEPHRHPGRKLRDVVSP